MMNKTSVFFYTIVCINAKFIFPLLLGTSDLINCSFFHVSIKFLLNVFFNFLSGSLSGPPMILLVFIQLNEGIRTDGYTGGSQSVSSWSHFMMSFPEL